MNRGIELLLLRRRSMTRDSNNTEEGGGGVSGATKSFFLVVARYDLNFFEKYEEVFVALSFLENGCEMWKGEMSSCG